MKRVLLSVFVLASLLSVLDAAPFQTLGMLRTPDAYVLPHKAAEILLVGYYRDVAKPSYVDPDMSDKKIVPYGMLGVGLGDRVELGFFGGDKVYYFNAKLKLIQETLRIPQVSVGVDNVLSPVNRHRAQDWTPANAADWDYSDHPDKVDYEYWSPYLVASKQMVFGGVNWMFNLGVGSNRFTGQVPRSRLFNGIFYSIELSPFKNFFIQGEYSGHDFNAGLKYNIGNFGIKVAGQAIEDLAKDNGYEENLRLALGVSYLFDKYAKAKRRPDMRELAKIDDELLPDDEIVIEPDEIEIVTPDTEIVGPEVVVETPVVETPEVVAETPVVETPEVVVETPVVETPEVVVETPVVETPEVVVETPVVETPEVVVETPVVETPEVVVETPVVETPEVVVETPVVETPEVVVETPVVETPEVEVVVETPVVETPEVEVVVETPVVETPEVVVETPVVETPEVVVDITTNPDVTGPVTGEITLGGLEFTDVPGTNLVIQGGTYRELSPEVKELLDELKQLRVEREKAQKALSDLRKWLDEQKQKK